MNKLSILGKKFLMLTGIVMLLSSQGFSSFASENVPAQAGAENSTEVAQQTDPQGDTTSGDQVVNGENQSKENALSLPTEPRIDRTSVNLVAGSSTKVKVLDYSGSVRWKVSNSKIATTDSKGVVTGKKKGNCYLYAKLKNGTTLKVKVRVTNKIAYSGMKKIAHRGDVNLYPENSIPAFKKAMKEKCNGIELDVYYTDSGDLMVFHDEDLLRMCGKDVPITDVSVNNRKKYPLKQGSYSRKHKVLIPTLEEVLTEMSGADATVFIHLKPESRDVGELAAQKVIDTVRKSGIQEKCVVFTRNYNSLRRLNTSGLTLGWLSKSSSREKSKTEMDWCTSNGVKYMFCFMPGHINNDIVEYAHGSGMKIGIYKAQTRSDVQYARDLGVDFVMLYNVNIK